MAKLPKFKVKGLGWNMREEIRDLEQARHFPFRHGVIIMVEGEVVRSYDDIVQLLKQERYKDREFLEVMFLPVLGGG